MDAVARADAFLLEQREECALAVAITAFENSKELKFLELIIRVILLHPYLKNKALDALWDHIFPLEDADYNVDINFYNNCYISHFSNMNLLIKNIADAFHGLIFRHCEVGNHSISRLLEVIPAAYAYYERLLAYSDPQAAARYVASRVCATLFTKAPQALDFYSSRILSLEQRPYVVAIAGVEELFYPFQKEGMSSCSPYHPIVRATLESPYCLAILTASQEVAEDIERLFGSNRIRAKSFASDGDDQAGFYGRVLVSAAAQAKRWHVLKGRPFRDLTNDQFLRVLNSGFDGCFLINQTLDLSSVMMEVITSSSQAPLIITTQQLFRNEAAALVDQLPHAVITTMADWFDDSQMAAIDAQASRALQDGSSPYVGEAYTIAFNKETLRGQGEALKSQIDHLLTSGASVSYAPGLGISQDYWKNYGREIFSRTDRAVGIRPTVTVQSASHHMSVARVKDDVYLFLTPLNRVRLADDADVEIVPLDPGFLQRLQRSPSVAGKEFIDLARRYLPEGQEVAITTTVHEYRGWMACLGCPVNIVVDGYHPPNYSRSYIDYYDRAARILCREPLSAAWFSRFGWTTVLEPSLLQPLRFAQPELRRGEKLRILVGLNHAGDWSALIQRSDTDRLVAAVAMLAERLPSIEVRVRPHPTMAIAEHEGIHSLDRLCHYVTSCNLANFTISSGLLADDMAWSNFVLSEYSQVLIDAWAEGKPGLIVNLTGRRSYLQPYEDLGFAGVNDVESMIACMAQVACDPAEFLSNQSQAASKANQLFAAVAGKGISCPACGGNAVKDGISHRDFPPARVKHCEDCGHGFVAGRPSAQQLENYYRAGGQRAWSIIYKSKVLDFMRRRAEAQVDFIEQFVALEQGASVPLLDLGCGMGTLCEAWERRGLVALGIDVDKAVINAARLRLKVDLRLGDMTTVIPDDQPWRVVAMSHFLEHVVDVNEVLSKIREGVDPGSWLFIEVPKTWNGYFETCDDMEGHLHFFTENSLRQLLERHGFTVAKLSSYGPAVTEYIGASRDQQTLLSGSQIDTEHGDGADGLWFRCIARLVSKQGA